jgi:hypothetical protein
MSSFFHGASGDFDLLIATVDIFTHAFYRLERPGTLEPDGRTTRPGAEQTIVESWFLSSARPVAGLG